MKGTAAANYPASYSRLVISTVEDPVKGWLDNFNGPVGMLVGGGKGILRVVHANPTTVSDFIPVDVAIKAMLITTHKRGIKTYVRPMFAQ